MGLPVGIVAVSMFTDSWMLILIATVFLVLFRLLYSGLSSTPLRTTIWRAVVTWLDGREFGSRKLQPATATFQPLAARISLSFVVGLCGTVAFGENVTTVVSALVYVLNLKPATHLLLHICGMATTTVFFAAAGPALLLIPMLNRALISARRPKAWKESVDHLKQTENPVLRKSVFMGRVMTDQSPLLVPIETFREHVHFLGDTGTGKTSMGLLPLMEQLMSRGDCSVVVIDLKGDSQELLTTLQCSAEQASRRTGADVPVKHFSNQSDRSSFVFNPLTQPHWNEFGLYTRTDILCAAMGLNYGSDYGAGYYSSTNAGVLYHTMMTYPSLVTFRDLADRLGHVAIKAKKRELHPEVRRAGVHVHEVLKRLASFDSMNVTDNGDHDAEVTRNAINMEAVFRQPHGLYFHLPATLAPGSSPEIARLVTYFLLSAAAHTERKHQVYLVIDEFQRMVAQNIEYILQLARSMDVSVILANQSMQDLKAGKADLIPTIDANCRYRQWFGVSAFEDRQRLTDSSGETIQLLRSESFGTSEKGSTHNVGWTEHVIPRLTSNHILLASDHPRQSIVRISRGAGYAQFGGMPFVVESDYHISQAEYERRRAVPWPKAGRGSFMPGTRKLSSVVPTVKPNSGLNLTREVIREDASSRTPIENPFADFLEARKQHRKKKSRRRKSKGRRSHDAE